VDTTTIPRDGQGSLWMVTTGHKLARWQNGVFKLWRPKNGIKGSFIRKFLVSSNGDIWIAEGWPEILQVLHADTLTTISLPSDFHHTRTMAEDNHGNVFVAGAHGELVRVWSDHDHYKTEIIRGLPRQTILCLSTTPDGSLWIGYKGIGVGRFKNGQFALIGHEQGLYDNSISQIVDDEQGSLWFGSDHGIFRVSESMLDAVAEGRLTRVQSIHYGSDQAVMKFLNVNNLFTLHYVNANNNCWPPDWPPVDS
jgi:ligand-binding sensor domain-containing protein